MMDQHYTKANLENQITCFDAEQAGLEHEQMLKEIEKEAKEDAKYSSTIDL